MKLENIILIIICSLLFMGILSMICSVKGYITDKRVNRVGVVTEAKIIPIEMASIYKTTYKDVDREMDPEMDPEMDREMDRDIESQISDNSTLSIEVPVSVTVPVSVSVPVFTEDEM